MQALLLALFYGAAFVVLRTKLHKEAHRLESQLPKARVGAMRGATRRKNPRASSAAARLSQEFHGSPVYVRRLKARERRLPETVVVIGDVPETWYNAPAGSQRAGEIWRHLSGDTGATVEVGPHPQLVADPRTRRVYTIPGESGMLFDEHRGLIA